MLEVITQFQSTRPSRGATSCFEQSFEEATISIHAPLAGRDVVRAAVGFGPGDFNPRAPRGARLGSHERTFGCHFYFNPRAPRGARQRWIMRGRIMRNFNPRAPRGARRHSSFRSASISLFQSTRPSRGATAHHRTDPREVQISIHAPLAGRDQPIQRGGEQPADFNPRAPRGARRGRRRPRREHPRISIHAPLAGRDTTASSTRSSAMDFNPRAPRGARQQMCTKITYIFALIHKRNTFSCQTPSVRALSKKLSGRFSHKIRCEPPCKTLCAAAPHYTISVPSGRYVCLQPKCSILLSYFFPK